MIANPTDDDFTKVMDKWYKKLPKDNKGRRIIHEQIPLYFSWFIIWCLDTKLDVGIFSVIPVQGNYYDGDDYFRKYISNPAKKKYRRYGHQFSIITRPDYVEVATWTFSHKIWKREYRKDSIFTLVAKFGDIHKFSFVDYSPIDYDSHDDEVDMDDDIYAEFDVVFVLSDKLQLDYNIEYKIVDQTIFRKLQILRTDNLFISPLKLINEFIIKFDNKKKMRKKLFKLNGNVIHKYDIYFHLHPYKFLEIEKFGQSKLKVRILCNAYNENDWFSPDGGPGYMYTQLDFYSRQSNNSKLTEWANSLKLTFGSDDLVEIIRNHIDNITI